MVADLGIPLSFMLAREGLKGLAMKEGDKKKASKPRSKRFAGGNDAQGVEGVSETLQGAVVETPAPVPSAMTQAAAPVVVHPAPAQAPASASASAHGGKKSKPKSAAKKSGSKAKKSKAASSKK
jgi:hypothetical protein